MIRAVFVFPAAVALAACGARADLQTVPGITPPATPYGAAAPPAAADLTTADTQARPERSDELLEQSEERRNDEFDRPPPSE